jgi:integrase
VKGSKRRRRGRGSSTVWELRVSAGADPVTKKTRYISRSVTGNAELADEKLAELVTEVTGGEHAGEDVTFGSLLDRWLAHAATLKALSPTTVREHRRSIEKNIKPVLGDVALRKLDGKTLDSFYAALMTRERPLSASSVRRCHAVIAAACKQGVKWGELRRDPATGATPPTVRLAPKTALTADEVRRMIEAAEAQDPDMATFIALAAITGARRGELCGLRWSDVDEATGTLRIERAYCVVAGKHTFKGTKTHGVRRIALGDFGLEVLRRQRARLEDRARYLGIELAPETPILTYDLVLPINPDTASHYVGKVGKSAGVRGGLHALRHFVATELIGGGTDVRTVAGRLGHADASTTLRIYSHVLPQRDRDAAASLGAAIG